VSKAYAHVADSHLALRDVGTLDSQLRSRVRLPVQAPKFGMQLIALCLSLLDAAIALSDLGVRVGLLDLIRELLSLLLAILDGLLERQDFSFAVPRVIDLVVEVLDPSVDALDLVADVLLDR
jgi:hypothetical protein